MTVELLPSGVTCNLSCPYCYQTPLRDAGNAMPGTRSYDMEKMKQGLIAEGTDFTIFGGEALLTDINDLEELWRWGLERYGRNGVQTNGTLITDQHIELFKKYKVHVGISMDGPDELNDSRWAGSLEKTRENTRRSQAAVEKLCKAGIPPSIIATLYRGNALPAVRPRFKAWIKNLDAMGVNSMRLHILEVDHPEVRRQMALSDEENIEALLDMANFELQLGRIKFDLFADVIKLLRAQDQSITCIWGACDPLTTSAVRGVDGQGEQSNCGRTDKEGVSWVKADVVGHERQLALYHTPWEDGGCKGCRFFVACKGQCPGTGLESDWRSRTDQCKVWFAIFEHFERFMQQVGIVPISQSPDLPAIEAVMLKAWEKGGNMNIYQAQAQVNGGSTEFIIGDNAHGDAPHGDSGHGDSGHGDSPHGDSHEDSWNPDLIGVAAVQS